jgi:hypothetical protein
MTCGGYQQIQEKYVKINMSGDCFLPLGQNIFSRFVRTIFFSFFMQRNKIFLPNLTLSYIVKSLPQIFFSTHPSQIIFSSKYYLRTVRKNILTQGEKPCSHLFKLNGRSLKRCVWLYKCTCISFII